MLPNWTVPNNYKLAEIEENITTSISLPLATLEGVTTKVISGKLPLGLRLENNQIVGTPFEVDRPTTSTFVIRASTNEGIADRTFFILVQGEDEPRWVTTEGRLPIGPNGVFFILDNSLIDFQLTAIDPDLPAGDNLEFRLTGGELPPGITLTNNGRLVGIVDPLLALDINVIDGNYDRNPLDIYPFDFGSIVEPGSRTPRKLNREYFFRVTVYDNVSSVTRQFQVLVVGDDFARADNTIMKAADGVFTADFTFLRVPLWLTSSDLGIRRANNYLTIFLDAYDSNLLVGELQYFLEPTNDDGTESILPPGLVLDSKTGEIAGRVPYQPAVTRDYKFTINAIRFNAELGLFTVFGTFLDDVLAGTTSTLRIGKTPRTLFDGLTELQSLVGRTLSIENRDYQVISVNESDLEFDTITLNRPIEPLNTVNPIVVNRQIGNNQDFFFANTLTQFDRNFYFKKLLNYSNSEIYRIDDVFPYIEWEISTENNEPINLTENHDSTLLETTLTELFTQPIRDAYIEVERNNFDQAIKIKLLIPSTAQNRNKSYIESLFESEDSGVINVIKISEVDRIKLDDSIYGNLNNVLSIGAPISLGIVRGGNFSKTFSRIEEEVANKRKTFNIRLIGEVDSVITWITPKNLGVLQANRISTLFVQAKTTVKDSLIKYSIVNGNLPPGLTLSQDGEIIGKVPVSGTEETPGLLRFVDNGSPTTFDFGTTIFDREYTFTVLAKDRFKYSAIERDFTIKISDEDNLNYSNIFLKPYLTQEQRQKFISFVDNARIFVPRLIYRPSDLNFGVQKNLKCLVYAGIENLDLENYVSTIAKNHRRKKFYFGELKTAIAKEPGTNKVIYEVVYVEIVDRNISKTGTIDKIKISTENKITVDSVNFETKDDNTISTFGIFKINVLVNSDAELDYFLLNSTIQTNNNGDVTLDNGNTENITILLNNGLIVLQGEIDDELASKTLLPDRYRPNSNTIKSDSNAITTDQNSDNTKYLSNINTMRQQIKNTSSNNTRAISNREFLPLWMRTPQEGSLNELDYVLALPIVYTKPGQSQTIKENIENSKFNFNELNFDIDRYIIDNTKDVNMEQYILFANYRFNI
jgi:hypothetical protein